MEITPDTLKEWLKDRGYPREWLAKKCNVAKPTIDGWFTRKNIPSIAYPLLERIIAEEENIGVLFTFKQWNAIQDAMRFLGYDNFNAFVIDAVKDMIEKKKRDIN